MNDLRAGAGMLLILVLALLLLPAFFDVSPDKQSLLDAFAPPGADFLLGADQFGRSVLVRLVEGGRLTLGLSLTVVVLCTSTGVALSALAVWMGGVSENVMTTIADGVYAMPGLLIVLVVSGLLGGSVSVMIITLWLASWPEYYRLTRSVVRRATAGDHVLASRMLGVNPNRIIVRQVLPQVAPYVIGLAVLSLGRVVLAVASLGFLGVGVAAPQAEWGAMIVQMLPYVERAQFQLLAPVLAIVWTVTACLLVGQRLTDLASAPGRSRA